VTDLRILPPDRLHSIIDESSQLAAILSKAVARSKGTAKSPKAANF